MAKEAVIHYPDELPGTMKLTDDEFVQELTFLAAAKLYELGRLTAGQGARLAGMSRVAFLSRLSAVCVAAINLRGGEVDSEIQAARELAQ